MLILLLDVSKANFSKIEELSKNHSTVSVDVEECPDKDMESDLINTIINSTKEKFEILLVRFSGSLETAKEIGDVSQEMVIPISSKINTPLCSLNSIQQDFENLLALFVNEKEKIQ